MSASVEELVSLVLFGRVVQEQSFTAAAKKLGLSKSAVSAKVAELEDRLGMRLLQRTTRRLTVTEAGLELYARCARILAEADAATTDAKDMGRAVSGTLKVNAPQVLSQHYLAALLQPFLAQHPQLRLELVVDNRFVDVLHDGYDLVLRIATPELMKASTLAAKRLAEDELIICAAPSYLAQRGTPLAPPDLISHSCLRYATRDAPQPWQYSSEGKWKTLAVDGQLQTNDAEVLLEAAVAGGGLMLGPSFMFRRALSEGKLQRVLAHHRFGELTVYALFAHRKLIPAKVRAAVDHLASTLPGAMRADSPGRAARATTSRRG